MGFSHRYGSGSQRCVVWQKFVGFFQFAVTICRIWCHWPLWIRHFDFFEERAPNKPMYVFVRFRQFSLQIFRPSNWRRVAFFREIECSVRIQFQKLSTLTPANLDSSEPWLRRTLTPDNRVVSVGWKISSWTRLGSSGFGFSSFSSSVAAPSLVLNVDFNTCEWNELYYNYIRRLR